MFLTFCNFCTAFYNRLSQSMLKSISFYNVCCRFLIDIFYTSFYNVFRSFPHEMYILHYVFASQFQKWQFLQCFWDETAATCFLQWFQCFFNSTEKLSFTKSFSCFCDLYVLKCSFYIMFLWFAFLKCRFYNMFLAF